MGWKYISESAKSIILYWLVPLTKAAQHMEAFQSKATPPPLSRRSRGGWKESLYDEVQVNQFKHVRGFLYGEGALKWTSLYRSICDHMGPLEQTDSTENFTFPQFHWRVVKTSSVASMQHYSSGPKYLYNQRVESTRCYFSSSHLAMWSYLITLT